MLLSGLNGGGRRQLNLHISRSARARHTDGNDRDRAATGIVRAGVAQGRGQGDEADDIAVNRPHCGLAVQGANIDTRRIKIAVEFDNKKRGRRCCRENSRNLDAR